MTAHLDWETLNDVADGVTANDTATRHLAECAECAAALSRLRGLLLASSELTRTIAPPDTAWNDIRTRVESEKIVQLPTPAAAPRKTRHLWRIAASFALIALSSSVTALYMTARNDKLRNAGQEQTASSDPAPASLVSLEKGYLDTVHELTAALDASRDKLAPETIRAVERSLRAVDAAIAEARAALIADPASTVLRDMLSNNYKQKVELLRRTAERARMS